MLGAPAYHGVQSPSFWKNNALTRFNRETLLVICLSARATMVFCVFLNTFLVSGSNSSQDHLIMQGHKLHLDKTKMDLSTSPHLQSWTRKHAQWFVELELFVKCSHVSTSVGGIWSALSHQHIHSVTLFPLRHSGGEEFPQMPQVASRFFMWKWHQSHTNMCDATR